MASRTLKGTIVSTKMKNTAVVQIEYSKVHPVYGRRYKIHRKLKAHYEDMDLKDGDFVTIQEIAKVSKTKSWKVVNGNKKAKESK